MDQRVVGGLKNASWLPAVLLILVQMAIGMRDSPQFAFFLIYLKEVQNLTPAVISSVIASAQIAGMVTALLGGTITARLGSKWVLACGLTLSGLTSLAFQAQSPGLAPILWILGGAGMALSTVGSASYLTQIGARGKLGVLAAFYALSMTFGGAIGNPIAGLIVERYGFSPFSWSAVTLTTAILLGVIFLMPNFHDQTRNPVTFRSFWSGVSFTVRQANVRLLVGLRCLPTIFYGTLTVLIPLLMYNLTGSKVMVAAYGTTFLVVASAAQLLVGRSADRWGARLPTQIAYSAILLSGLGLVASAGSVWGLFVFGVLGNAAAWSLSTLMYVWVNDGVPKPEHPATFGLLHAVWSLSMVTGSMLAGMSITSIPGLPFLAAGLLNIGSFFLVWAYYNRSTVKEVESSR